MKPRKHAELIKQWADDDSLVIEIFLDGEWKKSAAPCFLDTNEYRIKPTKPSIDWSHVAEGFNFLACDAYGVGYLFSQYPNFNQDWDKESYAIKCKAFASFKRGTCDWKDSLVQRPEGE